MSEYTSNGISVSTLCDDCIYLDDYDLMCRPCIETQESKLADLAHELVDEGNDIYEHPWSRIQDNPSASEWVAPQTKIGKAGKIVKMIEIWDDRCHLVELSVKFIEPDDEHQIRHEFLPPIVQIQDGGTLDNLYDLSDYTQAMRDALCPWCSLITPRQFNECQNTTCGMPLELNVR